MSGEPEPEPPSLRTFNLQRRNEIISNSVYVIEDSYYFQNTDLQSVTFQETSQVGHIGFRALQIYRPCKIIQ